LPVLLFSISASAQKKVAGVVLDATSGTPLNGATISIKNGNATALSRNDGKFDINVPTGKAVLVVSFVGYQSQDIAVGANESNITINLARTGDMGEVVVIGYGTKKKVDLIWGYFHGYCKRHRITSCSQCTAGFTGFGAQP